MKYFKEINNFIDSVYHTIMMNNMNYETNQRTFKVYIVIEAYFNRYRRVFLRNHGQQSETDWCSRSMLIRNTNFETI